MENVGFFKRQEKPFISVSENFIRSALHALKNPFFKMFRWYIIMHLYCHLC